MKVLGIMGSPRPNSNTDLLLEAALEGARGQGAETEKIVVDKLDISPCREYSGCLRDGKCVIEDDMNPIYTKLLEADAVIVASPIFFYALSAQTKMLIDRCQALWARRYILKTPTGPEKKGAFIAVGATQGDKLFDGAVLTIKYFFKAINAAYSAEFLVRGVDKKGEITRHPEALEGAREMGKKLVSG